MEGTEYALVPGLNWMEAANFTHTIWADTLHKMCNLTGCTYRQADRVMWEVIAMYEEVYGLDLYLTGQVFAEEDTLTWALAQDKEFWEDLVQCFIRTTQQWLERGEG